MHALPPTLDALATKSLHSCLAAGKRRAMADECLRPVTLERLVGCGLSAEEALAVQHDLKRELRDAPADAPPTLVRAAQQAGRQEGKLPGRATCCLCQRPYTMHVHLCLPC